MGGLKFFEEQVSTNIFLLDTFYGLATMMLFLLGAFGFIKKAGKGLVKVAKKAAPLAASLTPAGRAAFAVSKFAPKKKPRSTPTPENPAVPEASSPTSPFPSVESYARTGRLCIPCTFE